MSCLVVNNDILINKSPRVLEVMVAPRHGCEDMEYNVKVGPTSDSRSGSIQYIRIQILHVLVCHMKQMLDTVLKSYHEGYVYT